MDPKYGKVNLRRLRLNSHVRQMVKEVNINHHQFIQPYFVVDGLPKKELITGLTGVYRETPDSLLRQVENDLEIGCNKMLLFGVANDLDYDFILKQIESLKSHFGDQLWIATDVCLCTYTDHGHCGILKGDTVANDPTLELLAKTAVSHAVAGADIVAPSDMMDGRVGAI